MLSPSDLISRPDNMDETVLRTEPLKFIKTVLKSFRVLLGLSPVLNLFHTTGATKRSVIVYDEIEDKKLQRISVEYHLVY